MRGKTGAKWCKPKSCKPPFHHWRNARSGEVEQNLQKPSQTRFHGDNTGSNPVGDANKVNNLSYFYLFFTEAI
jgi:hypothetical protein